MVAEIEKVLLAASLKRFDAPDEVIQRAVAIMPERKKVWARLLSSSLASAGARRVSSDFQVVVGDEETCIRLMVNQAGKGWTISGKLPSPEWSGTQGTNEFQADDLGRFSFEVAELEQSGFVLSKGAAEMHVPPLSQLIEDGREGRN